MKQAEAEVKGERRPDFPQLSLGLSLNFVFQLALVDGLVQGVQ
jgi:hypothetical protein